MKYLVWDTSTKTGTVATLVCDERAACPKVVSELNLSVEAVHSEKLLWAIHHCLEASRWTLRDLDFLGVGVGPGSFTGLRIGVTTARTLGQAVGVPIVEVSSLAAMARPVVDWVTSEALSGLLVVAATDACKGELYAAFGSAKGFRDCVSSRHWKRGIEEGVYTPEELMKRLKKKLIKKGNRWVVVGNGRRRYEADWRALGSRREWRLPQNLEQGLGSPSARMVGQLAWEGFQAGKAVDALEVFPRYLRASNAELNLRRGKLKGPQIRTDLQSTQ